MEDQIALIRKHKARLEDQLLSRYYTTSLPHALAMVQLAAWQQTLDVLLAISNGKTVQPS